MANEQISRQAIIEQIVREKFGGQEEVARFLPNTDDAAKLNTAADALVKELRKYSSTWPQKPAHDPNMPGLSEGERRYANSIVLPDAAAASVPFPNSEPVTTLQGLTEGQARFANSMRLQQGNG